MDSPIYFITCVVIPVVLILAFLVVRARALEAAGAAVKRVHATYQESLAALKKNPTNPDLRQETLALGRAYSNLTRDQKGITVYNEMAVMNDINAATAAAAVPATISAPPVPG